MGSWSLTQTHTHTPLACFILPTLYFAPFHLAFRVRLQTTDEFLVHLPSLFSHLATLGYTIVSTGHLCPKTTDALLRLGVMFWNPSGHPRLLICLPFLNQFSQNLVPPCLPAYFLHAFHSEFPAHTEVKFSECHLSSAKEPL